MKKYLILISVWILSLYICIFMCSSIYTRPTKLEAIYKVTNGFTTYYTNNNGAWTPFSKYTTTFKNYYAMDYLGRWVFNDSPLQLSGTVTTHNDTGRD